MSERPEWMRLYKAYDPKIVGYKLVMYEGQASDQRGAWQQREHTVLYENIRKPEWAVYRARRHWHEELGRTEVLHFFKWRMHAQNLRIHDTTYEIVPVYAYTDNEAE